MLTFNQGWNTEIQSYANRYGPYKAYLETFDTNNIISALWDATGHFNDNWVRKLLMDAQDIHDEINIVTIEQGTHQPEDHNNGFKLHFTGRDADGVAFHFYVTQANNQPHICSITYKENGQIVTCHYQ
jgi:hypothetical protein